MVLKYVDPVRVHSFTKDPILVCLKNLDGSPAGWIKPKYLMDRSGPGLKQVNANIADHLNQRAGLRGNFPFQPIQIGYNAQHIAIMPGIIPAPMQAPMQVPVQVPMQVPMHVPMQVPMHFGFVQQSGGPIILPPILGPVRPPAPAVRPPASDGHHSKPPLHRSNGVILSYPFPKTSGIAQAGSLIRHTYVFSKGAKIPTVMLFKKDGEFCVSLGLSIPEDGAYNGRPHTWRTMQRLLGTTMRGDEKNIILGNQRKPDLHVGAPLWVIDVVPGYSRGRNRSEISYFSIRDLSQVDPSAHKRTRAPIQIHSIDGNKEMVSPFAVEVVQAALAKGLIRP